MSTTANRSASERLPEETKLSIGESMFPPKTPITNPDDRNLAASLRLVCKSWSAISLPGERSLYQYPTLLRQNYAKFAATYQKYHETLPAIQTLTLDRGPENPNDLDTLRTSLLCRRTPTDIREDTSAPTASQDSVPSASTQYHINELVLGHGFLNAMAAERPSAPDLTLKMVQFLRHLDISQLRYPQTCDTDVLGIKRLLHVLRATPQDPTSIPSKRLSKIFISADQAECGIGVPNLPGLTKVQVEYQSADGKIADLPTHCMARLSNVKWTLLDANGNQLLNPDHPERGTKVDDMRRWIALRASVPPFPKSVEITTPSDLQALNDTAQGAGDEATMSTAT